MVCYHVVLAGILCLQVERAWSKMLCAVDYIFNLLCAFNCLQPMKKFVFSVASRATGRLQIKPSGSGDENVMRRNKNVVVEGGTVFPYYILVIRQFS